MVKGLHPMDGQDLKIRRYSVAAATNATAIYKYAGVLSDSTGTAVGWDGTASDKYIGPAMNIYNSSLVEQVYLAASTAGYVDVATNPDLRLSIQSASTQAETGAFNCADLSSNGGNTTTGMSTAELSTTLASDDQFKILGIVDTPSNDWGSATTQLEVVAALHALRTMPNGD